MKYALCIIALVAMLVAFGYFFVTNQKDESKQAEIISENKNIQVTAVATSSNAEFMKRGSFNKIDALHYATGTVLVEKVGENYKLKFQSDFASAEGPDLYVYLAAPQDFKNQALLGVDTSKTISIGTLKKINGEQEYLVSTKDFEENNAAVIIWCKKFGVQFSRADLN
jgi:hypothetical protein